MAKALDCHVEVTEFELQTYNYIHFGSNTIGKGMKPLILQAIGYIVSLVFFYKDGFGIK